MNLYSIKTHTHLKWNKNFRNILLPNAIHFYSFFILFLFILLFVLESWCEPLNDSYDLLMGCKQQFENHCLRWLLQNQSTQPNQRIHLVRKVENWADVGWLHLTVWKQAKEVRSWEAAEGKFLVWDVLALWSRNRHSRSQYSTWWQKTQRGERNSVIF